MRIASIEIHDTLGTEHAKFPVGSITRIRGANGLGKSSILKALSYIFEGGTAPEIIRKGAERSVITITLDDGTVITKTTRPKRARSGGEVTGYVSDLEIIQPDGTPREAPKAYINQLSELVAIDPTTLLKIDATTVPGRKALAAELMRLVPISFSREEVLAAIAKRPGKLAADASVFVPAVPFPEILDLDAHKKLAESVTEERRRVGITRDASSGAVDRLKKALPEGDAADHAGALAKFEEEQVSVERQVADREAKVESLKSTAFAEAQRIFTDATAAADKAKADADLAAERACAAAKALATENLNKQRSDILKLSTDELESIRQEAAPIKEQIAADIAVVKEKLEAQQRAVTLREELKTQSDVAYTNAVRYDRLSEVLQSLEALRLEKLNNLPVAGLVVEDGIPKLDDIPWWNVNKARQVEAVLQVCSQRWGDLPLVLIDDSEHLDTETRAYVTDGLAGVGAQVIMTIVSDCPLTIETSEGGFLSSTPL